MKTCADSHSDMPNALPAKACIACREQKPLTAFLRNGNAPDGRMARCRDCVKAEAQRARDRHSPTISSPEARP